MTEMFCERVRRLRLARGFTHRALGERLGVNYTNVWRWETGTREPQLRTLPNLASALGVTTDYLISGREAPRHAALIAAIRSAGTRDPRLLALVE